VEEVLEEFEGLTRDQGDEIKIKILLSKRKNKTTILTGGRQRSPLLLNFPGAILGPLYVISALLLPILSF